ncbi:MAG: HEAT repeat domain-containing protein, partial [Planctomycetaceae bacterium]|nr:HEAT repeat domain-containing protein [Planctomycetaceae bacterium]
SPRKYRFQEDRDMNSELASGPEERLSVLRDVLFSSQSDRHPKCLKELDGFDERAIPIWRELLSHSRTAIRLHAVERLGRFGGSAQVALPELVYLLASKEVTLRRAAKAALENVEPNWSQSSLALPACETLVQDLSKPGLDSHLAVPILASFGEAAVPILIEGLGDFDQDLKQMFCAKTLGEVGPAAASAAPTLMEAFSRGATHVRLESVIAFRKIHLDAPPIVNALAKSITEERDVDLEVRLEVVKTLATVMDGTAASRIIVWQLVDNRDEVVNTASDCLVQIGSPAVPVLRDLLVVCDVLHENQLERVRNLLRQWGILSTRVYENESNRRSQQGFASKMVLIEDAYESKTTVVVEAIWKLAKRSAVQILARMGPVAHEALPDLISLNDTDDALTRVAVAEALGTIAPDDSRVLGRLDPLLDEKTQSIREAAIGALKNCAPFLQHLPEFQAMLSPMIEGLDSSRGESLERHLSDFGPSILNELLNEAREQGLYSPKRVIRERSSRILGAIGTRLSANDGDPAMIESIKQALLRVIESDQNGFVQNAAQESLDKIKAAVGSQDKSDL